MRKSSHAHHHRPRVRATVISETPFKTPSTQINPLAIFALLSLFGRCPSGVTGLPCTGFGLGLGGLGLDGLGLGGLGLGGLGFGGLGGGVPALCSGVPCGGFGSPLFPGVSPFGAALAI